MPGVHWFIIPCGACRGGGVVDGYDAGALECPECGGDGHVAVSPKDRIAMWPGGPFRGMQPGRYEQAVEHDRLACLQRSAASHTPTPTPADAA